LPQILRKGPVVILLLSMTGPTIAKGPEPAGYLAAPTFKLDDTAPVPAAPYQPQPGDIFLATDQALWARVGHWLAGGAGVHHSGIVFQRSDGRMALIEAGPFNSLRVEIMDPVEHMREHVCAGDKVWVRRRCMPLTPEQSQRLTAFLERQDGKPFAAARMLAQVTPFRVRGPVRTCFLGGPHGDRSHYFCSELVVESCVAAGLMDPATARPGATYPRDLFFGRSINWYLDRHLDMEQWDPPARWCEHGLTAP
jgi:hypothetical protein